MANHVSDKDFGFKKLKSEMKNLGHKPFVKVGIQGTEATKTHDNKESKPSGITVVEIGNIHEFGLGVPERSFLRSTLDENRNKYSGVADELKNEIKKGKFDTKSALGILGEKIVRDIKKKIKDKIPPELSQDTIDKKGSSTPLIDTGQLYQSITYSVEMKGE